MQYAVPVEDACDGGGAEYREITTATGCLYCGTVAAQLHMGSTVSVLPPRIA
jgi:hypothetical protein